MEAEMSLRLLLVAFLCLLPMLSFAASDQRSLSVRPKAPTGETAKGDLWLLTIGINNYLSWPKLKTAVNDAKAVKSVLLKRYHLAPDHIIELTDEQATRHNIITAFRSLAHKVKTADSLMVYYAGHGHIDNITGKGSWIPVESGTDDPTNWISNRDVTDYLNINAIKAKHVLLISDSCFSGDFFRGNRSGLPTITDNFLKQAYTRSSRQAISSGGLEPVSDAGFGGNSVFSHFLIAALESNRQPYLIPSAIFSEIKAGVGRNANQLPQFGDLFGTGGQDGGELILFLKGATETKLQDLGATSVARQKELEQLKKAEQESFAAKQKEQVEIAKKQAELDALDKQIAEMKARLGSGIARSGDSLDTIMAMVEQKEAQARHLIELRRQRETEEQNRQQEIERLKKEAIEKRTNQIKADIAKYQKIASSEYGKEFKETAWRALVNNYPEARGVAIGDIDNFLSALGFGRQVSTDLYTGMKFISVPEGCISTDGTRICVDAFRIGKYEVTQGQWKRVMGNNPSVFGRCGDNCPVENVSWNDVQNFIQRLNQQSGSNYRLPTEAEWEYACRAGENHEYCGSDDINTVAWYDSNSDNHTHPVGQKQANAWGIYDMSGNTLEWVQDWLGDDYPTGSTTRNPTGPPSGFNRVFRGGGWGEVPAGMRVSSRGGNSPDLQYGGLGFRLAAPAR